MSEEPITLAKFIDEQESMPLPQLELSDLDQGIYYTLIKMFRSDILFKELLKNVVIEYAQWYVINDIKLFAINLARFLERSRKERKETTND